MLAVGQPVAAVCAVVYSDNSAILVENYCYAVAVGGEFTLVILGEYPDCLGCSGAGGDSLVDSPLTCNCFKLLCANGQEHRTFVTGALGCASCLCAFCIGASAAVRANAFTLVAYALLCANLFFALCVLALAADRANVFTFVSVAFALFCASFFCAFSVQALSALFTFALAEVRSLGESDVGDNHLCAYCTVTKEERTGKVAGGAVGSNDHVFAFLTGCECLLEVVGSSALGCIYDTALVFCIIVLAVCTVVDANDLAVLIEDECFTPTVCPVELTLVFGGVKDKEVRTENGKILVNSDLFGEQAKCLVADHNVYKVVNNLYLTGNGNGILTVGCGQGDGVNAGSVDVKSTVVRNGNFNCYVVGRIKGAVIVGDGKTAEDCGCQIKLCIGQVSKNLIVVTGNNGSLVYVRSEDLLVICPKEANNVTVLVNNVVVHKAAAVGVNGGSAVAVLNNDCITACRNGEVLCKCTCNGNGLAVNFKRGYSTCGSVGVCSVYELGVSAVTALNYKAVCIDYSCYAVAACNVDGNSSLGCVVEYAADGYVRYVIAGKGYEFLILKGKEVALPLGLSESVCLNLESESGESLEDLYRTGSGSGLAILVNCLVGDGIGSFNVCIESVIVFDDQCGSLVTLVSNGYTEHKLDVVTCVDLNGFGNYADNGSGFGVCGRSGFGVCGGCRLIGCGGCGFIVIRFEEITCCKGEYKRHSNCDNRQKS